MGILRNVASQKWRVYAWDVTTGLAKTGDAANISAKIQIDDGAAASTNDVAPSEVHATDQKGYYEFDLTQAETNGAKLSLAPQSSTSNVSVIACPPVAYTVPRYLSMLNVASDGDFAGNLDGTLATLTTYTGNTPQTGDSYAIVNSGTHGNAALKTLIDAVDNFIDTEVADLTTELAKVPKSDGTASWNATALAALQSEANDALVALKLDHLIAVADADDPVDNSIIAKLASKGATADWSSFVNTTDALEAQRDNVGTAGASIVLASGALVNVTAWTVAITGNITGNLSGSVGSVTGAINTGSGVITTLDALDTAQDSQHSTTQGLVTTVDTVVDGIAADNPNTPTKAVQFSNFMFMMVDATDLNTPETGVTVTATISKDGGAFAACTNSVSEVSGGWYKITLTSTETNADAIALKFTGTGCAQRNFYMRTQPT